MNSPNEVIEASAECLLDGHSLKIAEVAAISRGEARVRLDDAVLRRVAESRRGLEALAERGVPIYGVNTGFGEMVHNWVGHDSGRALQENLLRSHCAGVGEIFSREESRAMMVARINALARGYSAIRPEVLERLAAFVNLGVTPAIPQIGSLGASGDLAPLAAMAITLMGEGYALDDEGTKVPARRALADKGLKGIQLQHKEGLSLINGTSAMTGLGCLVLTQFRAQVAQAEIIAALALEALQSSTAPFMAAGHELGKPHPGQVRSAANLRQLLEGSELVKSHETLAYAMQQKAQDANSTDVFIQKAYSLRCIPQVIGAVRDTAEFCAGVVERELNSANDNPLYFGGEELFHGGNFHGQHVAFAMDYLAIAAAQVGVISERRLNRLLNPHLNKALPEFLVSNQPGLRCGFAGAQYPATALVAENRTICTPASIQSVPANGDNQDVVSMGLIAARNAKRIAGNTGYILAIELLAACQAIDLISGAAKLSAAGRAVYRLVRETVPPLDEDRFMSDDIELVAESIRRGSLLAAVEKLGVELH